MFVSSYNKANVDCVFRQHWLFQPPWDEYISLRFASGNISSLGAYIINVALNPSQYLYNILYWQDHWPWIYISMKLCLTWNPQKFGCPQIIKQRTVFQIYRVYITNILVPLNQIERQPLSCQPYDKTFSVFGISYESF